MSITVKDLQNKIEEAENLRRAFVLQNATDHSKRLQEVATRLQEGAKELAYLQAVEPYLVAKQAIKERQDSIKEHGVLFRHSGGTKEFPAILMQDNRTLKTFEPLFSGQEIVRGINTYTVTAATNTAAGTTAVIERIKE